MMQGPDFKFNEHNEFDWGDLNKKYGRIVVQYPGDSDVNEGNFMAQVMFMDGSLNIYVLHEWDVRKEKR